MEEAEGSKKGVVLLKNEVDRSPIIILLSHDGNEKLSILSVPRDLYVPILYHDGQVMIKDKITHVTAFGGDVDVQKTINSYFQINPDFYSEMTHNELIELIDGFGGVEEADGKAITGEETLTLLLERNLPNSSNNEVQHYQILEAFLVNLLEKSELFTDYFPSDVDMHSIMMEDKLESGLIDARFYYFLNEEDLEDIINQLK
ncbi:LCP family glycopolymer transferase [Sutcliffiella rhizosphaerae]|uniref:Polyisoprenyl-teichoic acid--peptidoglycan teichoic acid transferase TagU n=1 Tax=Sutcliffiella rhizosphaerae TaxID=2880967 RepID=A0ABM8YUK4_9BACI|nr:LCP family protein [Sutcliffiella rhizosphaerae]CAG9623647.1 Polyisoprenyl-teichoic acid--peptidoglycan teichoic acid transferase TagU [Sutcliffiella rhizosphaerae]